MQKSKLGISVGLLGALLYFSGLFSGYITTIIVAGYILLAEENQWLRRTSVKAVALMIGFSVLSAIVYLLPDVISIINNLCNIWDGSFYISFINNIVSFLSSVISFVKTVVYLVLGFKALNQGTIHISVIDNLINKYMD